MKNNRKIIVYDKDYDYVENYDSIKEASLCLGIHKSQISRCLNQVEHYKTAHGYIFRYLNEDN